MDCFSKQIELHLPIVTDSGSGDAFQALGFARNELPFGGVPWLHIGRGYPRVFLRGLHCLESVDQPG